MKFLCADTDLSTKTKLKTVCKSCGSIDINSSCIHFIQELLCVVIIGCNDRLRMSCVVFIDVSYCLVNRIHDLNGKDEIVVFGFVIKLGGGSDVGVEVAAINAIKLNLILFLIFFNM